MKSGEQLVQFTESTDTGATITVDMDRKGAQPISRYLTGKFCEHLGSNIYNGMDAQILRNHTFAAYPFRIGKNLPDGGAAFQGDPIAIQQAIRDVAGNLGWNQTAGDRMVTDYEAGLAMWWMTETAAGVTVSPDTGPAGQRAQRVEMTDCGGISQWIFLPLHRVRSFEVELTVRGTVESGGLTVAIFGPGANSPLSYCEIGTPNEQWSNLRGNLDVPEGNNPDNLYRFVIGAEGSANLVVSRACLLPTDHVNGADPDVIRCLKDSNLPILRWPGGNFVSSYRWEDGIGPIDRRPTRANPAWSGVEPNTFGTDEFMSFCEQVGCEPMICINAGTGTPEEAARWVEYCNGTLETPMGKLRSDNGHPEPYGVAHWEIGNEIYGKWQSNWTTPAGYVDRYERFARAILAVDSSVKLYANGSQSLLDHDWNSTLSPSLAKIPATLTDHSLVGGDLSADTDPLDVFRDFMSFPLAYEKRFLHYQRMMSDAGVAEPRIAVTELQLFSHLRQPPNAGDSRARLTRDNHITPPTLAEALYATLYSHVAVRNAPLVEVVTHSATVNHGGGLRKERERVYANPCHYGRTMFGKLCGATPVGVEVETTFYNPPLVLKDLASLEDPLRTPDVDAVAAISADGRELLLSVVYRGTDGPVQLRINAAGKGRFGNAAAITELTAEVPWAKNDIDAPERIVPVSRSVEVKENGITVTVSPFTMMVVVISLK